MLNTIKYDLLKTAALISSWGLQEEHANSASDLHAAASTVSGSYRFDSIEQMIKLEATWLSIKAYQGIIKCIRYVHKV